MTSKNLKILLVDDDPLVLEMLGTILELHDFVVETAENGVEALEKYKSIPDLDLIVSDMMMPRMSGLDLIKALRVQKADIPIIIQTVNSEIKVALEAIKSGANDYLLKDEVIEDAILVSVRRVMEKHLLEKQNLELMKDLALKNEELETSNRELLKLNQLKSNLLGIVAYDLRNPLNSVIRFCEILLNKEFRILPTEQDKFLTYINNTSAEMLRMVNKLLDMKGIERGKLELQYKQCSLTKLVADRIKIIQVMAKNKNITIHTEFMEIPEIECDPIRITHVIDILMSNAMKFSSINSNIYVILALDEHMVTISVRDEGIGISEEVIAKIFNPIQQVNFIPEKSAKSDAFGLAIAKKIIETHHGSLDVRSKLGLGSVVSLSLPIDTSHLERTTG
ncbi:response regulator [candidate division CSSED10-310 bacterium]|uniref:histidine kinase n=1 Tax=candidate division CSSED10-310 bacterium TaxID=2855610 RepID=A0ABV6Z3X9_UNCC1